MISLNNKGSNIDPGEKTPMILFHILYQELIFTLRVREIMWSRPQASNLAFMEKNNLMFLRVPSLCYPQIQGNEVFSAIFVPRLNVVVSADSEVGFHKSTLQFAFKNVFMYSLDWLYIILYYTLSLLYIYIHLIGYL